MEIIEFLNLEVEIIRAPKRCGITLRMHPDKILCIKTNNKISQKQIVDFLLSKQKWIEANISKFKTLEEQFKIPTFTEGACFPFLGELKYLHFAQASNGYLFYKIEDGFLVCYLPNNTRADDFNSEELSNKLKKYYKSEAEVYLRNRLIYWSDITGLRPYKLVFRSNQTRWGSCSSRGHISLNWKLICQSIALIDYVIVHELCHLRYLNHSSDFWGLVETHLPSYETIKKVLNQQERLGRFLS